MSSPKAEAAIKLAGLITAVNSRVAMAVEQSAGMSPQTFRLLESIIGNPQEPVKFHVHALGLTKLPNCSYGLSQLADSGYIVSHGGPETGPRDGRAAYYRATQEGLRFARRTRDLVSQAVCDVLACLQVTALRDALATWPSGQTAGRESCDA